MTTARKAEANRRNARRSTGPRTPEGKARSAGNATKHGLTASLRALPFVEDGETWEAHLEQTRASLAPLGYLEGVMADRVAVLTWRLGRAVRFENEAAAMRQEDVERDLLKRERTMPHTMRSNGDEPMGDHEDAQSLRTGLPIDEAAAELLELLPEMPARKPVDSEAALCAIYEAVKLSGFDMVHEDFPEAAGVEPEPGLENVETWTAGKVAAVLEALAARDETRETAAELREDARFALWLTAHETRRKLATWDRLESEARRERLLPEWPTVENVTRYEAHLHRTLIQTLGELQRMQANRANAQTSQPAAPRAAASGGD